MIKNGFAQQVCTFRKRKTINARENVKRWGVEIDKMEKECYF